MPSLPLASVQSIIHFFQQGGFFMIPLALCSVISVAVIVVRGLALRRDLVMPPALEQEIERIGPGDDEAASRLARIVQLDHSALGKIIAVGLKHLNWPKSENMEAVQTRARHELVRLESGLFVLEVIVGIAPLLGLLGAVSGLVAVFASFGDTAAGQDPRGIARGISEALSTTIVGLAIAIPSLIAYSYFSKKIETMSAEMESLIADLLSKCYYHQARQRSAQEPVARRDEPEESAYAPVPSPRAVVAPALAIAPPVAEDEFAETSAPDATPEAAAYAPEPASYAPEESPMKPREEPL